MSETEMLLNRQKCERNEYRKNLNKRFVINTKAPEQTATAGESDRAAALHALLYSFDFSRYFKDRLTTQRTVMKKKFLTKTSACTTTTCLAPLSTFWAKNALHLIAFRLDSLSCHSRLQITAFSLLLRFESFVMRNSNKKRNEWYKKIKTSSGNERKKSA